MPGVLMLKTFLSKRKNSYSLRLFMFQQAQINALSVATGCRDKNAKEESKIVDE